MVLRIHLLTSFPPPSKGVSSESSRDRKGMTPANILGFFFDTILYTVHKLKIREDEKCESRGAEIEA